MRKVIALFSFLIVTTLPIFAQTLGGYGPGGVGDQAGTTPEIWLNGQGLGADKSTLTAWNNNQSGSNVTSFTSANDPIINTYENDLHDINPKVVTFVGQSGTASPSVSQHVISNQTVSGLQTGESAKWSVSFSFQTSINTGAQGLMSICNTGITEGVGISLTNTGSIKIATDNNTATENSVTINGTFNDQQWHVLSFQVQRVGGNIEISEVYIDAIKQGTLYALTIPAGGLSPNKIVLGYSLGDTPEDFSGNMADLVVFNAQILESEHKIVHTALGEKSVLNFPTFYEVGYFHSSLSGEVKVKDFSYELAGIGREADGTHTEAWSGILGINSSALSTSEYIYIGHNDKDVGGFTNNDAPDNIQRMMMTWKIGVSSTIEKSVSFKVDMPFLTAKEPYEEYILMVERVGDGKFSDGKAAIYPITNSTGISTVNNVVIGNGDFVSIATRNVVQHYGNSNNELAIGQINSQSFHEENVFKAGLRVRLSANENFESEELFVFKHIVNGGISNLNEKNQLDELITYVMAPISVYHKGSGATEIDFIIQPAYDDVPYTLELGDIYEHNQLVLFLTDGFSNSNPKEIYFLDPFMEEVTSAGENLIGYGLRNLTIPSGNYFINIGVLKQNDVLSESALAASGQIGFVQEERFTSIGGSNNLPALWQHSNFPHDADEVLLSSTVELNTNIADQYGRIVKGYMYLPVSSNYTFHLESDDEGEFWLSSTGLQKKDLIKVVEDCAVAGCDGTVSSTVGKNSGWYYFELHHKEGGGNDKLNLTWSYGSITNETIPFNYLRSVPSTTILGKDDGDFSRAIGYSGHGHLLDESGNSITDLTLKVEVTSPLKSYSYLNIANNGASNYNTFLSNSSLVKPSAKYWRAMHTGEAMTTDLSFIWADIPALNIGEKYVVILDNDLDPTEELAMYELDETTLIVEDIVIDQDVYIRIGKIGGGCFTQESRTLGFGENNAITSGGLTIDNVLSTDPFVGQEMLTLSHDGGNEAALSGVLPNALVGTREWCVTIKTTQDQKSIYFKYDEGDVSLGNSDDYQKRAIFVFEDSDNDGVYDMNAVKIGVLQPTGLAGEYAIPAMPITNHAKIRLGYWFDNQYAGTYDDDVAAMGKLLYNYEQKTATSDELSLSNPGELTAGDQYVISRNGANSNFSTSVNVPTGITEISNAQWRVSKYNHGEGTLDIHYQNNSAPTGDYLLLVDSDADFSDASTYVMSANGTDQYTTWGVTLQDGDYMAIAQGSYVEISPKMMTAALYEVNSSLSGNETMVLYPSAAGNFEKTSPCQLSTTAAFVEVWFDLGEDYNWGDNAFTADVDLTIKGYDATTGGNVTFNYSNVLLHLAEDQPEHVYREEVLSQFPTTARVEISVNSLNTTKQITHMEFERELRLRSKLVVEQHSLVKNDVSTQPTIQIPVLNQAGTQYDFIWDSPLCNDNITYELQLLKLYNIDESNITSENIIDAKVDWSQALSVETPQTHLPLTMAEGTGYYLWRVRAIGTFYKNGSGDSRNLGMWSTSPAQETVYDDLASVEGAYMVYYDQFDETKNFIFNRTFSEEGKIKEGITYANGLMQTKQSQYKYTQTDAMVYGPEQAQYNKGKINGNGTFFHDHAHYNIPVTGTGRYDIYFDAEGADGTSVTFYMNYSTSAMTDVNDYEVQQFTASATITNGKASLAGHQITLPVDDGVLKYMSFYITTTNATGIVKIKNLSVREIKDPHPLIVSQSVYDYSGRVAMGSLPAPVYDQTALGYREGFMTKGNELYTAKHFDEDNTYKNENEEYKVDGGALHAYYSNLNSDMRIASADGYPMSRTLFLNDGTGRARESSGPGQAHRMGGNHTVVVSQTSTNLQELTRVLGNEAPNPEKVIKTYTKDQNGVVSVSYTHGGQTLMTALVKTGETLHLQDLASATGAEFNVTKSLIGKTLGADQTYFQTYSFLLHETKQIQLSYAVTPEMVTQACGDYCSTCAYDIEIKLEYPEDCANVEGNQTWYATLAPGAIQAGGCTIDNNLLTFRNGNGIPSSITLTKGKYTLSRKISLNTAARENYVSTVAAAVRTDIDNLVQPIKDVLEEVKAGTKVMDDFITHLEGMQTDALTASDYDIAIYQFDVSESTTEPIADELLFHSSHASLNTPISLTGENLLLKIVYNCGVEKKCEIEIPLVFSEKTPCKTNAITPAFEEMLFSDVFGTEDWNATFGTNGQYSFNSNALHEYEEGDLDAIVAQMIATGHSEYTCEALWESAKATGQSMYYMTNEPPLDEDGNPTSLTDMLDNNMSEIETLVDDEFNISTESILKGAGIANHYLDLWLENTGYHFEGITAPSVSGNVNNLLVDEPFRWVGYTPGNTDIENMFCNLKDYDPTTFDPYDESTIPVLDYSDPATMLPCNAQMCGFVTTTHVTTTGASTVKIQNQGTDVYTFTTAHYELLATLAKTYDPTIDIDETEVEALADETIANASNACKDACDSHYDQIMEQLLDLYATNTEGVYQDENGVTMAYEDICCTAESIIEDCKSRCQLTKQYIDCDNDGTDDKLVSVGTMDEIKMIQHIIGGNIDIRLPAPTGATETVIVPTDEVNAMVELLNETFEVYSTGVVNELPLDEDIIIEGFKTYKKYLSVFKTQGYTKIKISSSPLGQITLSGTGVSHTFDFILDQVLTSTADIYELEQLSISNTTVSGVEITAYRINDDELILTPLTSILFEHNGSSHATTYSEIVSAEQCLTGYDRVEPPVGGLGELPSCVTDNGEFSNYTFTKDWDKLLGGNKSEIMSDVIITSDNSTVVVMASESDADSVKSENSVNDDSWIVKLSSNQTILWENTIQSLGASEFADLIELHNGNYLLVSSGANASQGYDRAEDNTNDIDLWCIEVSHLDGTIVREKTIALSASIEFFPRIRQVSNGDIIVTVNQHSQNENSRNVVARLDENYNLLWDKMISADPNVQHYWTRESIELFSNNDLLYAESIESIADNLKSEGIIGGEDIWLVKIDASGSIIKDKTIGSINDDYLASYIIDETDDLVLFVNETTVGSKMYILDKELDIQNEYTIQGVSVEQSKPIVVNGDYIVHVKNSNNDQGIARISKTGEVLWSNLIPINKFQFFSPNIDFTFTKVGDDSYIISGSSAFYANTSTNDYLSESGYGLFDTWLYQFSVNANCNPHNVCVKWSIAEPMGTLVYEENPVDAFEASKAEGVEQALETSISNCVIDIEDELRAIYNEACTIINDEVNIQYEDGIYHYTVYGHDRAGRLVYTIPPEGVDINNAATQSTVMNHTLKTEYNYNAYGQMTDQNTPDGGTTKFTYTPEGLIRFSENEYQKAHNKFSYTKYDALGRVIEVGELDGSYINQVASPSSSGYMEYMGLTENETYSLYGINSYPKANDVNAHDKTITEYSVETGVVYQPVTSTPALAQRYLRNRISHTYTDIDGKLTTDKDQVQSYYSYDVHGNVEWVVHDLPGLGKNYIAYDYDLISGNVREVKYNEGRADQFFHRYSYDAENKITNVATSHDGIIWHQDASYEFYDHGALAKTTIGENKVQGLDYVYTVQGWLKAINHPMLNPNNDPTKDGIGYGATGNVAKDEYAMALTYFDDDFQRTFDNGTNNLQSAFNTSFTGSGHLTANGKDLYNGNIAAWTSNIGVADNETTNEDVMHTNFQYTYDVLNRLVHADYKRYENGAFTNPANTYDASYVYDGNGNIKQLTRYGQGVLQDNMTYQYNYVGGKLVNNQLTSVTDGATDATANAYEHGDHTYNYDEIGNLVHEVSPDASYQDVTWTPYGKVAQVTTTEGEVLDFVYDAMGNRIKKTVTTNSGTIKATYYVRDASGNPMAVYKQVNNSVYVTIEEQAIYGTERLGMYKPQVALKLTLDVTDYVYDAGTDKDLVGGADLTINAGEEGFVLNNQTATGNIIVNGGVLVVQNGGHAQNVTFHSGTIINKGTLTATTLELNGQDVVENIGTLNITSELKVNIGAYYMNKGLSNIAGTMSGQLNNTSGVVELADGEYNDNLNINSFEEALVTSTTTNYIVSSTAKTQYELKDHLGNVRVVITDMKHAEIHATTGMPLNFEVDAVAYTDYYPFGSVLSGREWVSANSDYRYGFQGQEKDDEIKGSNNSVNYKYRIHDARLGRFLSIDPLASKYPYYSSYTFSGNRVVDALEFEGLEPVVQNDKLVGYNVQSGQGPTQIAADLNNLATQKKYGYTLIRKVDWYEVVRQNYVDFLTLSDMTMDELEDKNSEGYTRMNINVGHFLSFTQDEDFPDYYWDDTQSSEGEKTYHEPRDASGKFDVPNLYKGSQKVDPNDRTGSPGDRNGHSSTYDKTKPSSPPAWDYVQIKGYARYVIRRQFEFIRFNPDGSEFRDRQDYFTVDWDSTYNWKHWNGKELEQGKYSNKGTDIFNLNDFKSKGKENRIVDDKVSTKHLPKFRLIK